jgi:hypothetical protein
MITKELEFRGRTSDGQVFCQPLGMLGPDGLVKTAQLEITDNLHPRIQDFVKAFRPTPHGIYILVNALGAGEYWGSNANGDFFPEKALVHAPAGWDEMSPEEMKQVGSSWDYGFPTFMNAHVFTHHQNKDPAKSIGDVVMAVWNPKMHRVELILYIDRAKCMEQNSMHVIERIEQGEYPDVSMGCKVPNDVCMICGNISKTRADYCECITDRSTGGMNKVMPDGRKVAVRNDKPRFFDISVVFIGADKTAKVMAKLAENGSENCLGSVCYLKTAAGGPAGMGRLFPEEQIVHVDPSIRRKAFGKQAELEKTARQCPCERLDCSNCCVAGVEKYAERIFGVKSASKKKLSEILKDIPAGPFTKETLPKLESSEKDIPKDVLDIMGNMGLGPALSTPSMMGMVLKPHEFQRIILARMGDSDMADRLDSEHKTLPEVDEHDDSLPIEPGMVDDRLTELLNLMGMMKDRSAASKPLIRRSLTILMATKPTRTAADEPVLKKIAALYNGYRRSLIKKATVISSRLVSDPQLLSALYGDSMVEAFTSGIEKTASASVLGPESLAYLMGAHYTKRDHLIKSAGLAETLALSGIAVGAAA